MSLCRCGCGQPTPIATRTDRRCGSVAGQPVRFIRGHSSRGRRTSWTAQDLGHDTPCWIWDGRKNENGYALTAGGAAHRVLWVEQFGPVPDGHELDHLCRNRACVNPDHLETVTHAENCRRAAVARRGDDAHPLAVARSRHGLTQSALAHRLGCSQPLVALWETGKCSVPERLDIDACDWLPVPA